MNPPQDYQALVELLASFPRQTIAVGPETRRAAVALILLAEAGPKTPLQDIEALILHRAEHPEDPWSGHLSFPGGHAEEDDNSLHEVAQRETLEEAGFDPSAHGQLIGGLSDIQAMAAGRVIPMTIRPFIFGLQQRPKLRLNPAEVQDTLWVPLGLLLDPQARATLKRSFFGQDWTLPCYHIDGRILWGLTLRIFDELLQLVGLESDNVPRVQS